MNWKMFAWHSLVPVHVLVISTAGRTRYTYLKNFVQQFQFLPVPFVKTKVCITFAFEARDFLAIVRELNKKIDTL
jgi:hypothetical protein